MKEIFEQWAPLIIAAAAIAILIAIISSPALQSFVQGQFQELITTTLNSGKSALGT